MTIFLKQSTASQEVLLGPFLDDTDGKTAETALSIANTDIKVWKAGGTTEASKNSGGATHIASGRYYAVLDATDTDTVGPLVLNVHVAGALPVRLVCTVLSAKVFDSLIGATDNLEVDVIQWLGTAVSTPTVAGVPNVNCKTWNDLATVALPLVPTTAGRTLDVAATGEAGLDFNNILSSSLVTLHSLTVTGATTLTGIVTATNASNSIVGCGLTTATINATADQVWDEVLSGHLTVGTTGNALNAAGAAGDPWSTAIPGAYGAGTAGLIVGTTIKDAVAASAIRAAVGLAAANLDTQIAAVQSDTDNIQTRLPAALVSGRMDSSVGAMAANVLTASALATDAVTEISDNVWDNVMSGHLTAGTTGATLSNASQKSAAAYSDTQTIITYLTTFIQPDLDDIQTRLPAALVGGRMDSSVGAMAANVITAAATSADYLAEINAEVLDVINVDTLVAGVTVSQALRRIGALTSGIVTGAGTGTETFKDYAQSSNTIVITVDSSGNRSVITYN